MTEIITFLIGYILFWLLLTGWLVRSAAERGLRRWPRVLCMFVLFVLSTCVLLINILDREVLFWLLMLLIIGMPGILIGCYLLFWLLLTRWQVRAAAKRGLRCWPRVLSVSALFCLSTCVFVLLMKVSSLYYFKGILFTLCLGIWFGIFIKRKTFSVKKGIAAFCAVFFAGFALLYGNTIYAYYEFKILCKQAGIYTYKNVAVNGFYYGRSVPEDSYKKFLVAGYEYVEGHLDRLIKHSETGSYSFPMYRFSLDEEGNLTYIPIDHLISQYGGFYSGEEVRINNYVKENKPFRVVDLKYKETIAIAHRFTMGNFDSCGFPTTVDLPMGFEMILSTLPPINRRNTP